MRWLAVLLFSVLVAGACGTSDALGDGSGDTGQPGEGGPGIEPTPTGQQPGDGGGPEEPPEELPASETALLSAEELALFEAINAERESRGLNPVALQAELICAAQAHSADIGERRACTHTGADGSSPGTRVGRCDGDGWSGEIVACGHGSAGAAVIGWLGSPGHNAIMLDPGQKLIGVGMHNNYWTAIFDR